MIGHFVDVSNSSGRIGCGGRARPCPDRVRTGPQWSKRQRDDGLSVPLLSARIPPLELEKRVEDERNE